MGLDKKFDLVRKMADGEVFTALGPAERSALNDVLEAYDQLKEKYFERGNCMYEAGRTVRSLFMPYIKRIELAARVEGNPLVAITKIQDALDELNKHTPIG